MKVRFGLIDAIDWKTAYDAWEAAAVPSLRKYKSVIGAEPGLPISMLPMLSKIPGRLTAQIRHWEDSQALEQLSTQHRGGDILIDNWAMGQRCGVSINKSDKLIDDAQRDWSVLDMERLLITRLPWFPRRSPIRIRLAEDVLFTTYATLRADRRGEKLWCVRHVVESLGSDFNGMIAFDESYATQNASADLPAMTADSFAALIDGRTVFHLAESLPLHRPQVIDANRIELSRFTDTMRHRFNLKLRTFIRVDTANAGGLSKVLESYPLARVAEREGA
ncbi:strawberry notch-like NTP hydrolase domain-containing protein [Bradyrhizobium arachidis]|uniref:strawberry notch-like NTP hydrolase domain-containing protein n=1 Tax=Bradyrhizobium arachidis TaxID=858423 RepID=UPI0038D09A47